jgi:shikimate 5-dehydrogenase
MHQAAFDALGIEAHYALWETQPAMLAERISSLRSSEVLGANVTIPFKEDVVPFVDECDPLAMRIGAINTVVNQNGRLVGYNTDAPGFIQALAGFVSPPFDAQGKRAAILGTGGAARAAAVALLENGIDELALLGRTESHVTALVHHLQTLFIEAQELSTRGEGDHKGPLPTSTSSPLIEAQGVPNSTEGDHKGPLPTSTSSPALTMTPSHSPHGFGIIVRAGEAEVESGDPCGCPGEEWGRSLSLHENVPVGELLVQGPSNGTTHIHGLSLGSAEANTFLSNADLVVNATSVGLKAGDTTLLFDINVLPTRALVMDMIFNPPLTPFLRVARVRGCRILNGLSMLLYQGALSFELWTGHPAPIEIMQAALGLEKGEAYNV